MLRVALVMAYLVVRIKGTVNVPYWANSTLEYLNLGKKFNATIVPETKQTLGMLRKVKDIVAWCSADTGDWYWSSCPRGVEEGATNQSTRRIYLKTIQI